MKIHNFLLPTWVYLKCLMIFLSLAGRRNICLFVLDHLDVKFVICKFRENFHGKLDCLMTIKQVITRKLPSRWLSQVSTLRANYSPRERHMILEDDIGFESIGNGGRGEEELETVAIERWLFSIDRMEWFGIEEELGVEARGVEEAEWMSWTLPWSLSIEGWRKQQEDWVGEFPWKQSAIINQLTFAPVVSCQLSCNSKNSMPTVNPNIFSPFSYLSLAISLISHVTNSQTPFNIARQNPYDTNQIFQQNLSPAIINNNWVCGGPLREH